MNIRSLEHLICLSEQGSFSKAAISSFITQSALSRSIQNLEEEIGGKLVDRIGRKNQLTPLGVEVVRRARRILHEAGELKSSTQYLLEGGGNIRIGMGSGPASLLTTELLKYTASKHPLAKIQIVRGSTELQVGQLRSRELDVLIVDSRRVLPSADLHIEPITELEASFITSIHHPLAKKKGILFEELLNYPIASSQLSDEVSRLFVQQFGPKANPDEMLSLQCEDINAIIQSLHDSSIIFVGIRSSAKELIAKKQLVELQLKSPLKSGAKFALVTLEGATPAPFLKELREKIISLLN